jgi:hypothetical protein
LWLYADSFATAKLEIGIQKGAIRYRSFRVLPAVPVSYEPG